MKQIDFQHTVDYVRDTHASRNRRARVDAAHASEPARALVRFLIFLAIGGMLLAASAAIGDVAQTLLRR
jgi:fatty acid desaturase